MLVQRFRHSLAPLRQRNFSLLWVGQTISLFGDQCYEIAFIWLLTTLTHSTLVISTLITVGYLPQLVFLLIGGAWTDFVNPHRIAFWSDLFRLSVALMITLLATLGYLPLPLLFVVVITYSLVGAFFAPALSALFLTSVAAEEVSAAHALFQIGRESATLLGPALAGYLIAQWNVSVAFGFDAISYAFSVCFLALMRQNRATIAPSGQEKTVPGKIAELTAGLRFLWKQPGMLAVVLLFALTNAFNNVEAVLVPLLARFLLHMPAEQYGLMASSFGGGSLSGAIIMSLWGNRMRQHALVICGSMGVFGTMIIAMGLAQTPWQLHMAYFLFGFSYIVADVASATLWLHLIPAELRGRVLSVLSVLAMGLNPAGLLLAGILGNALGIREGIWIGGAAVTLLSGLAFLLPSVWSLDRHVQVALESKTNF
ncbi:MAG: MFS transporter [Ktedonobacteraceae bacterium]|nr:MFS transporter [Ktedonobacteraceae bacterium]